MALNEPRVAIIGAGIAGISAAQRLISEGFNNVTVLEGLPRIGGRIWTHYDADSDVDPYKLEMGANYIHGCMGNPIFALAKQHGLLQELTCKNKTRNNRKKVMLVKEGGDPIPQHIGTFVYHKYHSLINEIDEFFHNGLPRGISVTKSVEAYVKDKFREELDVYDEEEATMALGLLEHLLLFETSISGCDSMKEPSVAQFGSYETLKGGDPIIPQGYDKIVAGLAQDIPPSSVMLNTQVTCIKSEKGSLDNGAQSDDASLVDILSKQKCSSVIVSYKSRSKPPDNTSGSHEGSLEADCVIVTSSLGHLKDNMKTLFEPSLPKRKETAIKRLGIGAVDKIFLEFEDLQFFPTDITFLRLVRTKKTKSKSPSAKELLTCCCESKSGATHSNWTDHIWAFSYVNKTNDTMIMCWITGPGAKQMEAMDEADVGIGCSQLLAEFLGLEEVPLPKRVIRTQWYSNPFTRGAYSFLPVGATVDDMEALAEPILDPVTGKPRILFAGEATHTKYYSTTHGALLSGRREADRILQFYAENQDVSI